MTLHDRALAASRANLVRTAQTVVKDRLQVDLPDEAVRDDRFFSVDGFWFYLRDNHGQSILELQRHCTGCGDLRYVAVINSLAQLGNVLKTEKAVIAGCSRCPRKPKVQTTPWWRKLPIPSFGSSP